MGAVKDDNRWQMKYEFVMERLSMWRGRVEGETPSCNLRMYFSSCRDDIDGKKTSDKREKRTRGWKLTDSSTVNQLWLAWRAVTRPSNPFIVGNVNRLLF